MQTENNLQNQKNAPKAISTIMIPRQGNTRSYLRYLAVKQTGERYIICTYIYIISRFLLRTLNHLQDGKSSVCKRIRNVRLTIRNKRKMPTANTRTGKESYEK